MTAKAVIEIAEDGKTLRCAGEWTLAGVNVLPRRFSTVLSASQAEINIETSEITELDTIGAFRLQELIAVAEKTGKRINLSGLSKKHQSVFRLIEANAPEIHPEKLLQPSTASGLENFGRWSVEKFTAFVLFLSFLGEVAVHFCKMRGHGLQNLWYAGLKIIQTSGCQALPIVGMLSFLIGIVLSYQLGVQLKLYGADIYVIDASGIAILREFSPLMTSIIIAGRTSTAFAALIGTMKVNDELDALATMGISSIERLVLPRITGLLIALPLLTIWSSIFSILGSMIMAKVQLNIGYMAYLQRFAEVVALKNYVLGIVKTPIFAVIIASVGCFQGFQAGITADSVGLKTTAAAVQAIFLIIIADAFFSVLYSWRGL